jgi:adenylate kinase family enzyme
MGCNSSNTQKEKIILFVIGHPGSGQKTQSNLLKSRIENSEVIHVESLIRHQSQMKGNPKLDQINEDKLVPSDYLIKLLSKILEKIEQHIIIIEGFPKHLDNIIEWKNLIGKKWKIIAVIYLKISEETMKEREKEKIEEMGKYFVENKHKIFMKETVPLLEKLKNEDKINFIEEDGEKEIKEINENIMTQINKIIEEKKYCYLVNK